MQYSLQFKSFGSYPDEQGIMPYLYVKADNSGIAIVTSEKQNTPLYNIAGQRISKATKGIYIQNGKKYIVK